MIHLHTGAALLHLLIKLMFYNLQYSFVLWPGNRLSLETPIFNDETKNEEEKIGF